MPQSPRTPRSDLPSGFVIGLVIAAFGVAIQLAAALTLAARGEFDAMGSTFRYLSLGVCVRLVGLVVTGVAAMRHGVILDEAPPVRAAWILVGGVLIAVAFAMTKTG